MALDLFPRVIRLSTDLYRVRVLSLDPAERRVRFRVFVVDYDTANRHHHPLPDDPSFFLRILGERTDDRGPLADLVSLFRADEAWVDENTWRFVADVARTETRNFPVRDEDWASYADFYQARAGRWQDEERLVQADYDVRVTDARWLAHLVTGESWGTTSYPTRADRLKESDLGRVPDLRAPIRTLALFSGKQREAGTPGDLAFSDDGRWLAVTSDANEIVVIDPESGAERVRVDTGLGLFSTLMWAPGQSVVVLKPSSLRKGPTQWAYDVEAGKNQAKLPEQGGRTRSRSGRYRVTYGREKGLGFLASSGEGDAPATEAIGIPVSFEGSEDMIVEAVAFTADETRAFAGGMGNGVIVVDPAHRVVVARLPFVGRIRALACSPDGAYLAVAELEGRLSVVRTSDGYFVTGKRIGAYTGPVAWSPDGRWLAVNVVTGVDGYGGETRMFAMREEVP